MLGDLGTLEETQEGTLQESWTLRGGLVVSQTLAVSWTLAGSAAFCAISESVADARASTAVAGT